MKTKSSAQDWIQKELVGARPMEDDAWGSSVTSWLEFTSNPALNSNLASKGFEIPPNRYCQNQPPLQTESKDSCVSIIGGI